MPKQIVTLPPQSDLEKPAGWRKLEKDMYYAERQIILIVKTRAEDAVDGPSLQAVSYPPGTKYTLTTKKVTTKKNTESVQKTAELTISTTLSTEFLAKQSFGASAAVTGASLTFGQDVSEKIATELSTAAKEALSVTTTFEIENSEEVTRSIEVQDVASASGGVPLDLNLHLKLYEWHFDFYLVRLDQLTFEYRKRLFHRFFPVRRKVKSESDPKALPLFRLKFYEPIDELSLAKGRYVPAVDTENSTAVHVEPLKDSVPPFSISNVSALEDLAKIAFPVDAQERKVAAQKRAVKKAAPKKAAARKRFVAKRAAPARAAKRKAPARKAAKRAARKR